MKRTIGTAQNGAARTQESMRARPTTSTERLVTNTELPLEALATRLWRLVPEGLVEEIRDGIWWRRASVR
jgi:hypothetical protein